MKTVNLVIFLIITFLALIPTGVMIYYILKKSDYPKKFMKPADVVFTLIIFGLFEWFMYALYF